MGRKPSPFKENSEHNKGLDNVKKYDERAKKGEGYMRFIKSRNVESLSPELVIIVIIFVFSRKGTIK